MIRMGVTLDDLHAKKDIYIWEVSRDSLLTFSWLACRGIKINGFVTEKKELHTQKFLDVQVVGIESISIKENILLIVPDEYKNECNNVPESTENIEVSFYGDLLVVNQELNEKKIILCGLGQNFTLYENYLAQSGFAVDSYAIIGKNTGEIIYNNKQVFHNNNMPKSSDYTYIIAEPNEVIRNKVGRYVQLLGIKDICFFNEWVDDVILRQSNFFLFIDNALKKNKKLFLSKKSTIFCESIFDMLRMYSIDIEGYLPENIYDFCYENLDEAFVVITEAERSAVEQVGNQLEQIGLSIDKHDYVGIYPVQWKGHPDIFTDCMVECSLKGNTELPGVRVLGNRDADIKIIVLGGSTSTCDAFKPKSWVEFLSEYLIKNNVSAVIYNMSHEGQDVTNELLRLLRDGICIQPDYVISMSGVNNCQHKKEFNNDFNTVMSMRWLNALDPNSAVLSGLPSKEDVFSYWTRIEKVIKATTEIYGAKYLGFLQPMYMAKNKKNLFDYFISENAGNTQDTQIIMNGVSDNEFYINLIDLFSEDEGMYIDNCHYTTEANKKIAETVCEYLMNSIKN